MNKADRLKSHRERCPGLPKQTHKRRHEEIEDGPQEVETEVTTTPAAKRPKLQQSNINNYGCQTDHRSDEYPWPGRNSFTPSINILTYTSM